MLRSYKRHDFLILHNLNCDSLKLYLDCLPCVALSCFACRRCWQCYRLCSSNLCSFFKCGADRRRLGVVTAHRLAFQFLVASVFRPVSLCLYVRSFVEKIPCVACCHPFQTDKYWSFVIVSVWAAYARCVFFRFDSE